jgi:hypothetical protein
VIVQYIVDRWAAAGPSLRAATPELRAKAALATRVHDLYITTIQVGLVSGLVCWGVLCKKGAFGIKAGYAGIPKGSSMDPGMHEGFFGAAGLLGGLPAGAAGRCPHGHGGLDLRGWGGFNAVGVILGGVEGGQDELLGQECAGVFERGGGVLLGVGAESSAVLLQLPDL